MNDELIIKYLKIGVFKFTKNYSEKIGMSRGA